jgi:hypothetical protein
MAAATHVVLRSLLIAPTALRMKRAARETLLAAVTELVHAVSAKRKSLTSQPKARLSV